tara:strand:- start:296 stop:529 length:234 start_codon:yes stop_codon:yes gene_type:complete
METKKKVPIFPIDARNLFKTDREYNTFLHLLHSNGADGMIINGRDEKTYTKDKKELITYDRNGKILNIHTTQTKDNT